MTDARTATGFDRLPWLADEPLGERPAGRNWRRLIGSLVVAALVIAAGAYWLGHRTAPESQAPTVTETVPPAVIAPVQPPEAAEPVVEPAPVPEAEPIPIPTLSAPDTPTKVRHKPHHRSAVAVHRNSTPVSVKDSQKPASAAPKEVKRPGYPALWPSRVSSGASGRLVQIGAFGTRYQAKRGWWAMIRAYPALKRLPTVVNDTRNSKGRRFYRLQIGTTSQAHSEVLCQRMERIHFSCAVVGLPGEKKAVER